MESIPLSQITNAPLITSGTQNTALSTNARPIPAEVQLSPEGDSIILNGTEYNLKLVNAQQRQALIIASQFLVNQVVNSPSESSAMIQTSQLIALGSTVNLKLPEAITLLAQQNGISETKLYALSARPQGYPLPNVIVTAKEFQFTNGTVVPQDPGTRLNAGEYQAKITLLQGKPILVLTPMLSKLEIQIGAPINETQLPIIDKQASHVVISKMEPVQIIASFLRKLEGLVPQTDSTAAKVNTSSTQGGSISDIKISQTQTGSIADEVTSVKNSPSKIAISVNLQSTTEVKLTTGQTTNQQIDPKTAIPEPKALTKDASASDVKNTVTVSNTLQSQHAKSDFSSLQTKPQVPANELAMTKNLSSNETQLNLKTPSDSLGADKQNKLNEANINVNQVLQKAFTKAGALPIEQMVSRASTNLAAELLKHLPHLAPHPLGQLSDPNELKDSILGLATLNLATPQLAQASMLFNAGAISSLFQLLLGFRANNANSKMSAKLADYLEQLQTRIGLSNHQLGQFSKAGGLESMVQLASSLQLYQQASSENNGNLVWFFALPYGINQRHEQLEGKFEREADSDEQQHHKGWNLQLKFNLAQGPLLISARFHQQVLDIQFKGDSQSLLRRVDNFLAPLGQKLSQLGFTPGELSTQLAPVPATLLPGDHFLVKTRA
ncbi:MAG: hypothetical protein L0G80_00665 [Shewanella sp.]|uniref:hypothetical protein n=1 Tax=Shewanella sp. TaxID=50422 RepID=UPI0026478F45|nr:hypothetical protein [Shewanella sp.]MDN5498416.1 hypothetical protein [Shewanella sp.]MDN5526453.1 hypothetical protein [Shewanella sp.]